MQSKQDILYNNQPKTTIRPSDQIHTRTTATLICESLLNWNEEILSLCANYSVPNLQLPGLIYYSLI